MTTFESVSFPVIPDALQHDVLQRGSGIGWCWFPLIVIPCLRSSISCCKAHGMTDWIPVCAAMTTIAIVYDRLC
jgi:hypothetical protein